jgi:YggT family protein
MIRLYLLSYINLFFSIYSYLIFGRVLLSWVPDFYQYKFVQFIYYLTDPYLNFFRKFIPPIGGVLDLSPVIALLALKFIQSLVVSIL